MHKLLYCIFLPSFIFALEPPSQELQVASKTSQELQTIITAIQQAALQSKDSSHVVNVIVCGPQLHQKVQVALQSAQVVNNPIQTNINPPNKPHPKTKSSAQLKYTHIHSYWKWYSALSIYSCIAISIIKGNRFLQRDNLLAHWKKHCTIKELQTIPITTLTKELLRDIQLRYHNPRNPTDSIAPLIQFSKAIEHEKTELARYLGLIKFLKKCWISKLFPFRESHIEKAQYLEQRLDFINHLFISWSANNNFNQMVKT